MRSKTKVKNMYTKYTSSSKAIKRKIKMYSSVKQLDTISPSDLLARDFKDPAFGINTVGSCLRNPNQQLRADSPIPQLQVSPWLQSTIEPDTNIRRLGECPPKVAPDAFPEVVGMDEYLESTKSRVFFINIDDEIKAVYLPPTESLVSEKLITSYLKLFYNTDVDSKGHLDTQLGKEIIEKLVSHDFFLNEKYQDITELKDKLRKLEEANLYFGFMSNSSKSKIAIQSRLPQKDNQVQHCSSNRNYRMVPNYPRISNWCFQYKDDQSGGADFLESWPAPFDGFDNYFSFIGETDMLCNKSKPVEKEYYLLYNSHSFQSLFISSDELESGGESCIERHIQEYFTEIQLLKKLSIPVDDTELPKKYAEYHKKYFTGYEEFSEDFAKFEQALNNPDNYNHPDYDTLKQFVKDNYEFSDELDKKYKFTSLYCEIESLMKFKSEYSKFVKTVLPQILKELGLQKKRYSDGMYWYGLVLKKRETEKEKEERDLQLQPFFTPACLSGEEIKKQALKEFQARGYTKGNRSYTYVSTPIAIGLKVHSPPSSKSNSLSPNRETIEAREAARQRKTTKTRKASDEMREKRSKFLSKIIKMVNKIKVADNNQVDKVHVINRKLSQKVTNLECAIEELRWRLELTAVPCDLGCSGSCSESCSESCSKDCNESCREGCAKIYPAELSPPADSNTLSNFEELEPPSDCGLDAQEPEN